MLSSVGCKLDVVFQVRVHAPPPDCSTQWPAVVELMHQLKTALQKDAWKVCQQVRFARSLASVQFLRNVYSGVTVH